jgi:hypothetical protein
VGAKVSERPLCIELFFGCGTWSTGWLEMGGHAIGFDIEHLPHHGPVPEGAELVLQDVLTLHGSQFRNASLILASPPCQAYSYRAMPWKRAKALPPPSNELFDACFRIQREASEAAGHHIPMVVENVKGAQPWVGRAKAHFGSYYLWADVESIGGRIVAGAPVFGADAISAGHRTGGKENPDGTGHPQGSWFAVADSQNRGVQKREGRNFHAFENGLGSSPSFNGADHETRHVKQHGSGPEWFDKALDERRREAAAIKNGKDWFGPGENCSLRRRQSSGSNSRKAASAMIARIPLELSRYIANAYYPAIREDRSL